MMKLVDKTVLEFINAVDSSSPAPGGGSVSGLSASLGLALLRMVGHITVDRKAFLKLEEDQQQAFTNAWNALDPIKQELILLVDEDTVAFNRIMAAYKLPKDTEEEQTIRSEAIELATIYAIEVPLRVAHLCFDAMKHLEPIIAYGNKNALSDVGVGVLQLTAALTGALMNVKINVSGLSNETDQTKYLTEMESLLKEANQTSNTFLQQIFPKL